MVRGSRVARMLPAGAQWCQWQGPDAPALDRALPNGGVAEWSMAAVLKTANPQGFVGSNPTPSASTSTQL